MKNVRLVWDDTLHQAARMAAVREGKTLAAFVQDAVRRAVAADGGVLSEGPDVRDVRPISPARDTTNPVARTVYLDEAEPRPMSEWRGPIPKPGKPKR